MGGCGQFLVDNLFKCSGGLSAVQEYTVDEKPGRGNDAEARSQLNILIDLRFETTAA